MYLTASHSIREYHTSPHGKVVDNKIKNVKKMSPSHYFMECSVIDLPCEDETAAVNVPSISRPRYPVDDKKKEVRDFYRQRISESLLVDLSSIKKVPWNKYNLLGWPDSMNHRNWNLIRDFTSRECEIVLASSNISFEYRDVVAQNRVRVRRIYLERIRATAEIDNLEYLEIKYWPVELSEGFPPLTRGWKELDRFTLEDCTAILSVSGNLIFSRPCNVA